MVKLPNSRLSIASRLALLSAVLIVPLVLLTVLFVGQSWQAIAFAGRELEGVRYLSTIWPEFDAAVAGRPETPESRQAFETAARAYDRRLGAIRADDRFRTEASPTARAEAGEALITTVSDNSNLTLDTSLDTFYLMEAATTRLPDLARAATDVAQAASAPQRERAVRLTSATNRLRASAAAIEASLRRAANQAPDGVSNRLYWAIAELDSATDALMAAARPSGEVGRPAEIAAANELLQHQIDDTWRVSTRALTHLLEARRARLLARMWGSLALVGLSLAGSAAIAWSIAHGLAVRVRELKAVMMRLTAGDLAVDIPYRADQDEIGRIAGGVEAFKQASVDRARLITELESAYETVQEYQSWLKLALETGRMGAWRRKVPGGSIDHSPELASLLGLQPGAKLTFDDILKSMIDPDMVTRLSEDAQRAAVGAFDNQTLEEAVVPFRRFDSGEIRWAMLRREVVVEPARRVREIVGVAIDITERKHMMDELNHRVKNNLATVLSLAMQTTKSTDDLKGFMKAFSGRIQALSKINELLTRHGWEPVELKEVVSTALRPYSGVELAEDSPEDVAVSPRAAVSLCLVLHELAANAVQHGALADEDGRVQIAWTEPDPEHAALSWTERCEHPTPAPARAGFGANLIRRLTEGDLGGRADLDFRPEGLAATIYFALKGATA